MDSWKYFITYFFSDSTSYSELGSGQSNFFFLKPLVVFIIIHLKNKWRWEESLSGLSKCENRGLAGKFI